jgi:hypothetical protein
MPLFSFLLIDADAVLILIFAAADIAAATPFSAFDFLSPGFIFARYAFTSRHRHAFLPTFSSLFDYFAIISFSFHYYAFTPLLFAVSRRRFHYCCHIDC